MCGVPYVTYFTAYFLHVTQAEKLKAEIVDKDHEIKNNEDNIRGNAQEVSFFKLILFSVSDGLVVDQDFLLSETLVAVKNTT